MREGVPQLGTRFMLQYPVQCEFPPSSLDGRKTLIGAHVSVFFGRFWLKSLSSYHGLRFHECSGCEKKSRAVSSRSTWRGVSDGSDLKLKENGRGVSRFMDKSEWSWSKVPKVANPWRWEISEAAFNKSVSARKTQKGI